MWCDDWFPGDDFAMFDWNYGAEVDVANLDWIRPSEIEIQPRHVVRGFRPFLSLTEVESVVPAMNAVINKRLL